MPNICRSMVDLRINGFLIKKTESILPDSFSDSSSSEYSLFISRHVLIIVWCGVIRMIVCEKLQFDGAILFNPLSAVGYYTVHGNLIF